MVTANFSTGHYSYTFVLLTQFYRCKMHIIIGMHVQMQVDCLFLSPKVMLLHGLQYSFQSIPAAS